MKSRLLLLGVIVVISVIFAACGGGGGGGTESGGTVGTVATFTTGDYASTTLSKSSVGASGGTISISDASSPLNGLSIVVPSGATDEDISFTITYADISAETGLPEGAASTSKAIKIATSGSSEWNNEQMFNLPIKVTLPYTAPSEGESSVRFYVYNSDGSLEAAGLESMDTTNHTVTFYTRTFANTAEVSRMASISVNGNKDVAASATYAIYVAIGIGAKWSAWLSGGKTVDTGFTAASNGWYIPNYGSYYKASRGGSCFGFVGAAKYYYRKGYSPGLYSNYHDDSDTTTWLDDAVAIEFTSRVHNGMADIWDEFISGEVDTQTPSSEAVALSYVGAMYVTGLPALLYIQQKTVAAGGVESYSGAHAISVYRADIAAGGTITFYVYDPNFPKSDSRRITYINGAGFANYASGTDAASSSFSYNYFHHVGYHVGLSDAVLDQIKTAADSKFTGSTVFPTITITEVKGVDGGAEKEVATEGTTANTGEHAYVTNYAAVKISGTILGGLAQDACCVVNNARVFINNKKYSALVNNSAGAGDGTFSITVPVSQGDNELVIIGARKNSFSNWAAFKRDAVLSNASPAAMTVTLSWGQGKSDVDLYVKEPNKSDGSKTGDTVYFSHRTGTSSTNPYLDFDNTSGYGPEHYYALSGMKTLYTDSSQADNLYGTYKVRVQYYADHDSDTETTQPITWNVGWRYLAYCADPCSNPESTGFWVEGSQSGSLSSAGSSECCNINNSGSSWSSSWEIPYPQPTASDWVVPPATTVMLP